jgi:hypothetical protein
MISVGSADGVLRIFREALGSARIREVVFADGSRGIAFDGLAVPVAAGVPGAEGLPDAPDLDVLDWSPPPWLARIYDVYAGIGCWWPDEGVRWASHSLLPWDEVTPLTRHIRFGEENITYDPADVVRIAPDGRGGGWVLVGRDAPRFGRFEAADHSLWVPADDADEERALRAWVATLVRAWTEGIERDP